MLTSQTRMNNERNIMRRVDPQMQATMGLRNPMIPPGMLNNPEIAKKLGIQAGRGVQP